MKRTLAFITSPPLILATITALAYGILAPQLGFYWDDLPISWIGYELGPEALTTYFSTNRPAWGIWYGFLIEFIPHKPLYWQILALFWRWLTSVLMWGIVTQLFPKKKNIALAAALLFLLYPGFNQQSVSFVYGYHFTTYSLYLFSILAMLWGIKKPYFLIFGLLASTLNLLMGEYFFTLDLIRPFLLWIVFQHFPDPKQRMRRVFSAWFPYLIVFSLAVIGRVFIFNNQVYEYSLLAELKTAPLLTLWELTKTVFLSLYTTLISAWGQAFMLPDFELQGKVTIGIYVGIIFISFVFVLFALYKKEEREKDVIASGAKQSPSKWREIASVIVLPRNDIPASLIILGLIAALLAGIPFWMTGLPVSLGFPANRATLPFIFGSVLVLVGVLSLIPRKNLQTVLLTLIIAFSAGRQFLWADEFRRDWTVQRNLFWQMSWRIPALEEGTLILMNEDALKFYADNSLSAPLNWIYAPDTTAENIPYMLFYPRSRLGGGLPALEPDIPLEHDFIAGEFHGNTSQMVVTYFSPPSCLHILDPEVDIENRFISDKLIRKSLRLSDPNLVLPYGASQIPDIYGSEPEHGWCYYFEKAELARQRGDWEQAAGLGEKVISLSMYPNNPTEFFVFIEAYAHTNAWGNAEQLSLSANRVSPSYMTPLLCPLWERIERETPDSPEKVLSLSRMNAKLNCE